MTGTMGLGTIRAGDTGNAAGTGRIGGAVVVLEAAGTLGRGIVAAALEAGYPVVAVDHRHEALCTLPVPAAPHPPLIRIDGDVRSEAAALELADALRGIGRPLAAVIVAGDVAGLRGRLLDQPLDASCAGLLAALAPPLAAARHLLPLLADHGRGGSFVLIGGPGGVHPWAGYGHRSVAEAALRMLARVLHREARGLGVRAQLLATGTPLAASPVPAPQAQAVIAQSLALAIGRRALRLLAPGASAEAIVEFSMPETSYPQQGTSVAATSSPAAHTTKPPPAQGADSPHATLPAGCLEDARALLQRFAQPLQQPSRNQESSPR